MSVIKTVGIKRMVRNGLLGNRVVDHGAFFTLDEARQAVTEGHIELVHAEKTVNIIMIMSSVEKTINFYEWSFALSDWTLIGQGDSNAGGLANAFIRLTGSDEYIGFDDCSATRAKNVLKWATANNWTIYMKIPEVSNLQNNQYVSLVSHGSNNILVRMGGSNQGIYINGATDYQAGMNTWASVTANSMLVFRKFDTTLEYWLNGVKRGAINTSAYTDGTNGIIKFGSGSHDLLKGGVDNIVIWDKSISANDMNEISAGVPIEETVVFEDAIVHLKCGEDVYPNVVDHKGTLSGGKLFNGREQDFVEIVKE